jgi:RNA polymerase sigma-70 factor, ECF subfamily
MTDWGTTGHSPHVTALAMTKPGLEMHQPAAKEIASAADFDCLYENHFEFIWRTLRRLGVSRASLDDATQDVFVVAFRRRADFAHRSSARTWLAGIAIKVAADYRRRQKRKGGLQPLTDSIEDCRPGAEAHLVQFEALRRIDEVLGTLDDEKREVFVLSEWEGMTAPEISEITNTNLNTVYSRLRAARIAFDESLQRLARGGR